MLQRHLLSACLPGPKACLCHLHLALQPGVNTALRMRLDGLALTKFVAILPGVDIETKKWAQRPGAARV